MSELRPSFGERDKYLNLLSVAYADGRLDDDEFDKRAQAVLAALTYDDALAQFEGLPTPDIVPVKPLEPAPSSALYSIDPHPARYVSPSSSSGGVGRRAVSIGMGVAMAAVGLVVVGGFISFSRAANQFPGPFPVEVPMATMGPVEWEAEPTLSDPMTLPALSVDRLWEVQSRLVEEGLTSVVGLHLTEDLVEGSAMSPRAPREVAPFRQRVDGPVVVGETATGDAERTVDLDQLMIMMEAALNAVSFDLAGYPTEATLVWTTKGNPAVDVRFLGDQVSVSTARYDLDGRLIGLEQE